MVLNPWGTPPPPNSLEAYKPVYLTEKQVREKAFDIIGHLEKLPVGHALHVLEKTRELLLDCHNVDSSGLQFQYRRKELWEPETDKRTD